MNGKCTGPTVRVDEKGMADIEIRVDQYDGILAIHGGVSIFDYLCRLCDEQFFSMHYSKVFV